MIIREIKIEDDLQDRVNTLVEEVTDEMTESPEKELGDVIHEFADSNVPVYYSHIDGLWYLYSDLFEEAYENAGVGKDSRENSGMSAIYFYLVEQAYEKLAEKGIR